ncbi:MAG: trypsin-like peptidase domain-containing protein [Bacteroidales bacterium]
MKRINFIFLLLSLCAIYTKGFAQISQGGDPLPPTMLRHASAALFTEMEPFDASAMIKEDSVNVSLHRATRFAQKFTTDLRPDNSGIRFTTANGTRVWQCGIRSKGAYSINLLFSEYNIPKGAKLFIYNSDRTHKIGAFTDANNNKFNKLPTAPVSGDEIIVEYQEPANAEFEGKITIGEVNHDYRGVTFRGRPGALSTSQTCHRDAVCFPQYTDQAQATTLIIVNGNEYCTGCLVNNVEQDGTPYLLSAAHCFLPINGASSETRAQNTVIFFNYQNPSCQTTIIGSEEMSMASAELVANEKSLDLSLLKLMQKPPRYYRPYYAGWNADEPASQPYFGIHHPMSKTKKIATSEKKIILSSYNSTDLGYTIESDIHWKIDTWLDGTTEGGSSGSPLFDSNKQLIGALTGGASFCSDPHDDYYYSIQKCWSRYPENDRQLKHWLDPMNRGVMKIDGLDPYADSTCLRMSNVSKSEKVGITRYSVGAKGPLFGQNSLKTSEYGERFITAKRTTIFGFNFVLPAWKSSYNGKVTFKIYNGYNTPGQLISTTTLNLSYLSYSLGAFHDYTKPNTAALDNFVKLESPITVDYSFFMSYQIDYASADTFAIYNVIDRLAPFNSAMINDIPYGWRDVSDYSKAPMNTSLWIDPIIHTGETSLVPIDTVPPVQVVFYGPTRSLYFKGLTPLNLYRFRLFNTSGMLVMDKSVNWKEGIQLNRERSGVYIAVLNGENVTYQQKVVITGK